MADAELASYAEKRAQQAVSYDGFGVNLLEIKRTTAYLLSQIGKLGIFTEYTRHDISHIDEVLRLADWLVDDDTKKIMSDADWFLITLSIYFHDMGMLVTKDEYDNRDQSGFSEFCETELFTGPRSEEYKARVNELDAVDRDLFLYQEFVRFNHAKRVRQWIEGTIDNKMGVSNAAIAEVQRVLTTLDSTLRRDLALIAESHHLNDLDNLAKYKLVQPYGPSDAETANIQYCALVLRSADLLHMRRDRTPSVLFRLIDPTDPISQREWAKQNAVRRVMPRLGLNEEGIPDEKAPRDTIEVHARFTEENGFFGLTQFLSYAASEIKKCHAWAESSKKLKGAKHSFVWKRIAEDLIEAEGFLKETYSFDIDQYKILDLLIGHTLYNDTGVVLRELAQNGIDAIRLHEHESGQSTGSGSLAVQWDTASRVLTITDNGTGMTQEIIEKHLLKVGSSRYQDQKFKEAHPHFSAISRFGIGVLSAFMVSDEVEITTCSMAEDKARKISLRSVHGRYLVRLLDKERDAEGRALAPHGTKLRLKVRSTARLGSVLDVMRQWVVVPRCNVTVKIDNNERVTIGYKSVADAVESFLADRGYNTAGDSPQYKVISRDVEGVEFAYAARWSSNYHDWTIAHFGRDARRSPLPCTCVEGISVVFATPGMNSPSLLAIANARGPNAPKTNVARSTLEATPQRDALYTTVYGLFVDHVSNEIDRLMNKEYSLTWAANNAITLVPFGFTDTARSEAVLPNELRDQMKRLPVYIVERGGRRENITFNELRQEVTFWTIDSQLVRSAERLVREVKANSTVSGLVVALGDNAQSLPKGTILYNLDVSPLLRDSVEMEFEPSHITASESLRRAEIEWSPREASNWIRVSDILRRRSNRQLTHRDGRLAELLTQFSRRQAADSRRTVIFDINHLWLSSAEVPFDGIIDLCGISSYYRTFIRGDIEISKFLRSLATDDNDDALVNRLQVFATVFLAVIGFSTEQATSLAGSHLRRLSADIGEDLIEGTDGFLEALRASPVAIFDTAVWSSRYPGYDGDF